MALLVKQMEYLPHRLQNLKGLEAPVRLALSENQPNLSEIDGHHARSSRML